MDGVSLRKAVKINKNKKTIILSKRTNKQKSIKFNDMIDVQWNDYREYFSIAKNKTKKFQFKVCWTEIKWKEKKQLYRVCCKCQRFFFLQFCFYFFNCILFVYLLRFTNLLDYNSSFFFHKRNHNILVNQTKHRKKYMCVSGQ